MINDALVDEVRSNGMAFAARFNNDVAAMCKALQDKERASARVVVDRAGFGSAVAFRKSAGTVSSNLARKQ